MTASSGISDAFGAPQLTAFSPAYTINETGTHIQVPGAKTIGRKN